MLPFSTAVIREGESWLGRFWPLALGAHNWNLIGRDQVAGWIIQGVGAVTVGRISTVRCLR